MLDKDAFSNIDKFHDGSENIDEDDVSDESTDVAGEDWAGLLTEYPGGMTWRRI